MLSIAAEGRCKGKIEYLWDWKLNTKTGLT